MLQSVKRSRYCAFMTQKDAASPHHVIAQRMKELRRRHGWSAEDLAEHMRTAGVPWKREIVANLENGRRQSVTVEEWLTLAYVLSVAPLHLLVPLEDDIRYAHVPVGNPTVPQFARAWIRGDTPIGETDAKQYFAERPDSEWEPPADQWSPENVEAQSAAIRRRQARRGDNRGR